MSSEGQESREERELGQDNMNSHQKNTSNLEEYSFTTDCDDVRRSIRHMNYDSMHRCDLPKYNGRIYDNHNLERMYICTVGENKLNVEKKTDEQPLDFSNKSLSSTVSRPVQNNVSNRPSNDSNCDKNEHTPLKLRKTSKKRNGSQDSDDRMSNSLHIYNHGSPNSNGYDRVFAERVSNYVHAGNKKRCLMNEMPIQQQNITISCNDDIKLKTVNSSESEDESHFGRSAQINGNSQTADESYESRSPHSESLSSEGNGSPHSESLSSERNASPHSKHTISQTPHASNGHTENGYHGSFGKSDKVQSQDFVGQAGVSQSPQSTTDLFSREKFHSSVYTSSFTRPNQSIHQPIPQVPVVVRDMSHNSGVMFPSYMPTVGLPNPYGSFAQHIVPGNLSSYPGLPPYIPGTGIQQPFTPGLAFPYPDALNGGPDQQKQKQQRPFKSIRPDIIASQCGLNLQEIQEPSSSSPSNGLAIPAAAGAANSSPHRLSPDSPCIANGSSGNSNEATSQDPNSSGRKKIRRVPPEEKDEKYREKRLKNNAAAKKSREQRRQKEDDVAKTCILLDQKVKNLTALNGLLRETLADKDGKIERMTAHLIAFREKCDGRMREMFDEIFGFVVPQL